MKAALSKMFKYFLRFVWGIVGAIVLYLLIAIVCTFIPANGEAEAPQEGIEVYLISNGFHIDIALPARNNVCDWSDMLDFNQYPRQKNAQYLAFGWGDKGFFYNTPTIEDLTFTTVFKALFLSSPSVMHVIWISGNPTPSHTVKKVVLTVAQYQLLVAHLKNGFDLNQNGEPKREAGDGYVHIVDVFYTGKGSYSMLNTCNNWINTGLKKAGVKTATWAPFTASILYHRD